MNSSRSNNTVPNAPRGCISEIFSDPVKRHANGNGTANGNGVSVVDSPLKVRPRDTHSRLFGGPPPAAPPAVRNDTTRSHIQFGDATDGVPQRSGPRPSNGHTNGHVNGAVIANGHISSPKKDYIFRNPVTGLGMEEPLQRRRLAQITRREGNPVTGDGYKSMNGEINTSVTALNGNAMPINHNRIPPGGYSSGLW